MVAVQDHFASSFRALRVSVSTHPRNPSNPWLKLPLQRFSVSVFQRLPPLHPLFCKFLRNKENKENGWLCDSPFFIQIHPMLSAMHKDAPKPAAPIRRLARQQPASLRCCRRRSQQAPAKAGFPLPMLTRRLFTNRLHNPGLNHEKKRNKRPLERPVTKPTR